MTYTFNALHVKIPMAFLAGRRKKNHPLIHNPMEPELSRKRGSGGLIYPNFKTYYWATGNKIHTHRPMEENRTPPNKAFHTCPNDLPHGAIPTWMRKDSLFDEKPWEDRVATYREGNQTLPFHHTHKLTEHRYRISTENLRPWSWERKGGEKLHDIGFGNDA